ncbi:universal stress protein [Streptomyces sp. NPDC089919]|uniref:universal stress protein n=1 Tax=Streptomyces sp. NPDC089919 TaxID=3155188 RepID=UPI00341A62F4
MNASRTGPQVGPVVVGVDESGEARRAALWASDEAARRRRPLHLVHGSDVEGRILDLPAEAAERLREAGRALLERTAGEVRDRHPALSVSTELSGAGPAMSLRRAAADGATIVVGDHTPGGFGHLVGSPAGLGAAVQARTPVIVVKGDGAGPDKGVVLAAVRDGRDLDCARHAAQAAELRRASLRLLHVRSRLQRPAGPVGEQRGPGLADVAEQIRDEYPSLTVIADVDQGVSVAGVLAEASRHADLLVMGGRRAVGRAPGHAVHSLVRHAHCPVELVPQRGDQHRSEAS